MTQPIAVSTKQIPGLDRIVITAADGRSWNLGRPSSRLHSLRVRVYRWKRRSEFRAASKET